jgi:hypothetical protein
MLAEIVRAGEIKVGDRMLCDAIRVVETVRESNNFRGWITIHFVDGDPCVELCRTDFVARILPEPVEEGESWIVSHQGRYGTHTPGPWKIFDGWGASRDRPVVVDSIPDIDGKCVANCICHVASSNDNAEANARLIAAAPEMLEALEDILGGWRYIRQDPLHKAIYGVGWDRAQEKAEAAIRKAKGGTE